PHRARHFYHGGVELEPGDFRAPRNQLAHHLGPQAHQPHDFEMALVIDSREDVLQRTADLLGIFSPSTRHREGYDSVSLPARNRVATNRRRQAALMRLF